MLVNKCADPIWFWNFHFRQQKSGRKVWNVMFWCCSLIVREQGRLYTLSCVLLGTEKNWQTDKMKTNQSLHHLELLSSIQVQGSWFVKTRCGNKHIQENITYANLRMYNLLYTEITKITQMQYIYTWFFKFFLHFFKGSHDRWVLSIQYWL